MIELRELYPQEAAQIASTVPILDKGVGFFEGAGTAVIQGPKHGWDLAASAMAETLSPYAEGIAGTLIGDEAAEWIKGQTAIAKKSVSETRADPSKMGTAGNIIHSIGTVLTEGVMGGAVAGPLGAAAAIGGLSGYDKWLEFEGKVDDATRAKLAAITGATMGVGAALPPYLGKVLAAQVASGVGINVALGTVERGASSAVLENAGYENLAKHYKMLDGEAMLVDGILGALFPVGARYLRRPTTEQVDAALTTEQGILQQTRNPALETEFRQLDESLKSQVDADMQMFAEGRSFDNLDIPRSEGTQVPNPEFGATIKAGDEAISAAILRETGYSVDEWNSYIKESNDAVQVRSAEEMDVRQQAGDGKEVAARNAEEEAAGAKVKEEVTPESFSRAEATNIANQNPDMRVMDDEGNPMSATEALVKVADQERIAVENGYLHNVAVACALTHGT